MDGCVGGSVGGWGQWVGGSSNPYLSLVCLLTARACCEAAVSLLINPLVVYLVLAVISHLDGPGRSKCAVAAQIYHQVLCLGFNHCR